MPLYTSQNDDKFLQIESYVKSFPEISFVRYYETTGDLVFEDFSSDRSLAGSRLTAEYLEGLSKPDATDQSYVLDSSLNDSSLLRISKPIWTESFRGDGLIGVDLTDEAARNGAMERAVALTKLARENPKRFAGLASRESDCGSKSNGGALGQLGPGDTVPEFEAALRELGEGEITTEPVPTGATSVEKANG